VRNCNEGTRELLDNVTNRSPVNRRDLGVGWKPNESLLRTCELYVLGRSY
jgi:hypothetical protein